MNVLSGRQLDVALKEAEEMANKHGFSLNRFLLAIVYADKEHLPEDVSIDLKLRAQIAEKFLERVTPKRFEKDVNLQTEGPHIGLPPMRTDPAKIIPIDGGKKE